jgi:integrase/recombinase XerD
MIMLETHLHSPVTRRRLRKGAVADHIDAFADWLNLSGYKPISIRTMLTGLAGWTDWMCAAGLTAQDLLQGLDACRSALAKKHRVHYRGGPNRKSLTAASIFIRFLQHEGKLPRSAAPGASDVWPVLAEFRSWMRTHRGLTDTTLDLYEGIIAGLLDALGDDARNYSAESLRNFVAARARPHGISRANSIVGAVRSFLRYLGIIGQCSPGMEHAVPTFASWELSSVPRFLSGDEVERVISSCNGYVFELRDRAVILLLARLGLRASEVAHLRFTDIDWRNGTINVCGKGRRQESLPLPQEVGNAILLYVKQGRPVLRVPEVFTTVLAPVHAVTRAVVTHIVRGALRRAGIKAPINGAHVLRHSAATSMLRQGVSLAGVGAVLRHRAPETTAHYAKVDFVLLAEIAQPWPEVSSC